VFFALDGIHLFGIGKRYVETREEKGERKRGNSVKDAMHRVKRYILCRESTISLVQESKEKGEYTL